MKALILHKHTKIEQSPLALIETAIPQPSVGEVLIKVICCAVCRTDLHVIEGDLASSTMPIIPGHQVVGVVHQLGPGCDSLKVGDRVGVAWLGRTCGQCSYCREDKENLCLRPQFTGYELQGGYAEYMVAAEKFVYPLPANLDAVHVAPLLCAGIVGYRALKRSNFQPGQHLLILGFGSSAHLMLQLALALGGRVSVVTRALSHQKLALELGASRAGSTVADLPEAAESALLFAPAGDLVPDSLSALKRGGLWLLREFIFPKFRNSITKNIFFMNGI
ncbi:alcohol dehydrogenase catalytic domain-containing protein [Bdellovibrio sp. ArHS]|uniref:alcohol dehydrogenase catalytic domain-containing protein n=1 Tax=Bdellovibrio sp. ArHS TaxID=1569284 RepID=UPI000A92CF5B|nr:alcohol dehydrogenase catalytic domain-containing protein [Bdellovibrio sp. ArHS]